MGSKYREYQPRNRISTKEYTRIHPVWRGVGFVMMVLIPIISYAGASVLLQKNDVKGWFPLPYDLLIGPGNFFYQYIPDERLYIKLLFAFFIAIVLFAVFTLLSFIMNSAFGITQRNDPYYVPPIKRKVRRSR